VPSPKTPSNAKIAADWKEKYGEAIDCPELRKCAALEAVERERARVAALRVLTEFAELLRRQRTDQIAFFDTSVPGESASFRERLEAESTATGEEGTHRRAAQMTKLLDFLEGRDERAPLHAARFAHPEQLLQALQLSQRSFRSRSAELVEAVLRRHPESAWAIKTRAPDFALGKAAHSISRWIRKRHQNAKGESDERTS
jgi:hypothetical protein